LTASQLTDGSKTVSIAYRLKDPDTSTNPYNANQVAISYQYSVDSGSTWNNCTTVTNSGLLAVNSDGSWTNKTAVWNIGADLANQYYNDSVKVKVKANDNEQAHNTAELTSSLFTTDSKNPTAFTFTIAGGSAEAGTINLAGISATDDSSLTQMMISKDPAFSGASWQAYSASVSDFPATTGDTVYIKLEDAFGNVSVTVSHKVPVTVKNVVLSDLSNVASSNFRMAIGWDSITDDPSVTGYQIFRKVGDGAYSHLQTITDKTVNGAVDSTVDATHSYSYLLYASDSGSNLGMASASVSGQPAFVPTVSEVKVAAIDSDRATITWKTDVPCDSFVEFGAGENYGAVQGASALSTSHTFVITGLNSETLFHFRVRSRDQKGTLALSADNTLTTTVDTSGKNNDLSKTPSKISNVSATDTNFNSSVIIWKTSVVSLSEIQYGKDTNYGLTIADSSANFTTQHTVKVTGLEQGTAYHFRIKGTDLLSNTFVSDDYQLSTLSLPQISDIEAKDVGSESATITWKTNVSADSNVDYTLDGVTASQGSGDLVSEHSVSLINLKPASSYSFKVRVRDNYGNAATSDSQSFSTIIDTTPPVIKDMKSEISIITDADGVSKAQAIVSWSTDEPATSQIRYAMGVAAGSEYPLSTTEDTNLTTSHVMIISELQPSATYHMKLLSKDASKNLASSDDYTVLTLNQDKSLLQYIVQILEDRFSWLKTFGLF
jgi:hypothetical protein